MLENNELVKSNTEHLPEVRRLIEVVWLLKLENSRKKHLFFIINTNVCKINVKLYLDTVCSASLKKYYTCYLQIHVRSPNVADE